MHFLYKWQLCVTILLAVLHSTKGHGQDTANAVVFPIGKTLVSVNTVCYSPCPTDILYVNVHDNENTCMQAAAQVLCDLGGKLISIENCSERMVSFVYDAATYRFDPNRIFSQDGIKATMTLSGAYDSLAANEVAAFAYMLQDKFLQKSRVLVTLHNNTEGDLSVVSYRNDQLKNQHNGQTYINPELDADDFFLTTDSSIYERLKAENFNVVLENADLTTDDGSMSIYAGKNNIPYVNVEAQHEHLAEQATMLYALTKILKEVTTLQDNDH